MLWSLYCHAQVNINLPQANIIGRSDYEQAFGAGQYNSVLNLLPTISARASTSTFQNVTGGTQDIPLSLANLRLISIGNISLIGRSNEIVLSTTYQAMASSLANLLSGAVNANVRLVTSAHTWQAGTYRTNLELLAPGLLGIGNVISPASHIFNINVPAFIQPQTAQPVTQIRINQLSAFRSGESSTSSTPVLLSSTVPYIPQMQTLNSNFSFSTQSEFNSLPITPVSNVNVNLTGQAAVPLSISSQILSAATGMTVPTNNNISLIYTYGVSADKLQEGFIQAGTYSVPITYLWSKTSDSYPSTTLEAQLAGTLEIQIDDLGELVTNQANVEMIFSTTGDYIQGIIKDIPSHLRISKTTPYNIYIRSSSANFSSGSNQIPLEVLQIGPMPGQNGVQSVTLSTTPQLLIEGADPVIDRLVNLRYTIPSSQTEKLIGRPSAIYSTDIIFSFIAP